MAEPAGVPDKTQARGRPTGDNTCILINARVYSHKQNAQILKDCFDSSLFKKKREEKNETNVSSEKGTMFSFVGD